MQVSYRVYRYDELPTKEAKERALNWLREEWPPDDWWQPVLEEVKSAGALLGITVESISFDLYYRQVSFDGFYTYRQRAPWAVAAEWPEEWRLLKLARDLQAIQRPHFYALEAVIRTGPGCTLQIECYDARGATIKLNPGSLKEYREYRYATDLDPEPLKECLHDFTRWILYKLEAEMEVQTRDSTLEEFLMDNDFFFLEDGRYARLPQHYTIHQEENNAA